MIRAKLQLERRTRDLAIFNLAIDSKLRGCDLMALRVDDVAPNSYAIDRATVTPQLVIGCISLMLFGLYGRPRSLR